MKENETTHWLPCSTRFDWLEVIIVLHPLHHCSCHTRRRGGHSAGARRGEGSGWEPLQRRGRQANTGGATNGSKFATARHYSPRNRRWRLITASFWRWFVRRVSALWRSCPSGTVGPTQRCVVQRDIWWRARLKRRRCFCIALLNKIYLYIIKTIFKFCSDHIHHIRTPIIDWKEFSIQKNAHKALHTKLLWAY